MKTNAVNENFVIVSLKTTAMMRGVSWPLASWTATSSAEDTKTISVKIVEANALSTDRAASG